jgi:NAD+ kinase
MRVAIVCKPHKEELARLLPELIEWLRARGFEPILDREGGRYTATAPLVNRTDMPGHSHSQREPGVSRLPYRGSTR